VVWRNAARLEAVIRRWDVDIVHARSRAPAWSARWAARRRGVKLVTTFHGTYNAGGALKHRYNAVMTGADRVIAISDFIAEHVRAEYGCPDARIRVIPRGVDIRSFDPDAVSHERVIALARSWRIADGAPGIMLPGRLTRWKGQLDFIAALAALPDRNFTAVLAGDAQERDGYVTELRTAIDAAGLAAVVRIPGHCSDMPAAFSVADVVVAPSIEPEAFGRVAVEAQAMGKPLVASRLGAQTETVIDGRTGFLFEPGNTTALASLIAQALALTEDRREAMARAGRERVIAAYTVSAMCEATLNVYRRVL